MGKAVAGQVVYGGKARASVPGRTDDARAGHQGPADPAPAGGVR
jgi:hypothetical protein